MGVNFSPFEIGRRALRQNQLGINVTGRNIANVNTPGYTRQTLQTTATLTYDGHEEPEFQITQNRDVFIEARLASETAISGRLTAKRDALSPVDAVFSNTDAPGGLQSSLTEFFGAFQELEAQPNSLPLRSSLLIKADTMTSAFHATRDRLEQIQSSVNDTVYNTVDNANQLVKNIAEFNAQVGIIQRGGGDATALLDQRGEAVRKLAELTGARALQSGDGQVTVTLADGKPLVVGDETYSITAATLNDGTVEFTLDGEPAAISDGSLKGLSDALVDIKDHISRLDQLAASIADRVNTLHSSGTDLEGNAGTNFFDVTNPVTAANFSVSSAITADPRLVVTAAAGAGRGDATVARNLSKLLQDNSSTIGTETTSFDNFFSSLVTDAGAGVRTAEDAMVTQQAILEQTQAQRASVSGVSLDEEAVRLLQYQKAYEAAARFLKVANDMTQTILSLAQ